MTPTPASQPNLDAVTTIRDDGSRPFLFPADVRGRFSTARFVSALGLIAIYALLPWVKIGQAPAVFLDVGAGRFHLLGWTLAAQDLWLLCFLITGLGFTLFFVTSLLGRVWCGWACPHTVFLDHVFRRIERVVEGDAHARRQLAAAPWTAGKVIRRLVKHTLYLATAAAIAHLFLAYFVSLPEVWAMVCAAPAEHGGAFAFMMVATGILYFNFAWFREQLCIVICPYGRLQSVLTDDHSLVIGYDARRGEPRGKVGTVGAGACVGCNRCVQVCPTGIDIRQGLQLECVACAACVDACDEVMTRLHRPRGLVRYDSLNGLAGRATRWLRPRTVIYAALLVVGALVAGSRFASVRPAALTVTRMTGSPYILDDHTVRNQFFVRLVNKRPEPIALQVSVAGFPGATQIGLTEPVTLAAQEEVVRPLIVAQPRPAYAGEGRFTVVAREATGAFTLEREVEFIGPDVELLQEDNRAKGITQ